MRHFCWLFLTLSCLANAEVETMDYLYTDLTFADEQSNQTYSIFETQTKNGQLPLAAQTANGLLDQQLELTDSNPALYGKLLANLGMVQASLGEYDNAMASLDPALEFMETVINPFSPILINISMARGLVLMQKREYERSNEALRRAQHITHRTGGVYTPEQLEIVNKIVRLNLREYKPGVADNMQEFRQRVAEQAYGEASEELIPIFQEIAGYYARRGSTIAVMESAGEMAYFSDDVNSRYYRDLLFRRSFKLYERIIKIIEDNYGEDDLRLLGPLRGMANARLLQKHNRTASEKALERALAIVENNPDTDVPDRIRAMLDLGDMYTITGDGRATQIYVDTYQMMMDSEAFAEVAADAFGSPTRLYPEASGIKYLNRAPDAALAGAEDLYIELTYTVDENGRVSDVEVVDRNVPNEQVRLMRAHLLKTRFRPRILDGQPVSTNNLMLHQRYTVLPPSSSGTSINIKAGPSSPLDDN